MRWKSWASLAATVCANGQASGSKPMMEAGIYTNEEEVYFDTLAKRPAAPWVSIKVERFLGNNNLVTFRDAFGEDITDAPYFSNFIAKSSDRVEVTAPDGKVTELRRARPVSCWVAIRRDKPKVDGSEDWYFAREVKLHDQGGRAMVGGGDSGAQKVMIRLRNVTWDKGSTNAPVVALYIHKPDNWDKAESYSWAAPDSTRVGINLRWVQAGCTIEGIGAPSSLNSDNFKSNEEAKAQ